MKLRGKRAVITGSGRGLGREIALLFAREGADILVNSTSYETADAVTQEVRALGSRAFAVPADVSSRTEVDRMFQAAQNEYGGLDILINNAAILLPVARGASTLKPSEDLTQHEWRRVFEVNVDGTFFCCQAAAKYMIPQRSGSIINITSHRGIKPRALQAAYCCSKAAVIMLTKVLALEWIKHGIHVNGIAPGIMTTDMVLDRVKRGNLDIEAVAKTFPIGRISDPKEIARIALFLVSGECDYIVGETIFADGGFSLT